MKFNKIPLMTGLIFFSSLNIKAFGQCQLFSPTTIGEKSEITHFDNKNNILSKIKYEVINKKESSGYVDEIIRATGFDRENKQTYSGNYKVYCNSDVFKIDIKGIGMIMPILQRLESKDDLNIATKTTDLEFPSMMYAGESLKSAGVNISISKSSGSKPIMSINIDFTDRKVVGREKITTPAGTFDCVVITSIVTSKIGIIRKTYNTKEWFAKNVGLVRSETYKKQKLKQYAILTGLQNDYQ